MQEQHQFAYIVLRHSGEYAGYSATPIAVHVVESAAQQHADQANDAKDALLRKKLAQGYAACDIHMADEMPLDPTLGVYYDRLHYSVAPVPLVAGLLDAEGLRAWLPPAPPRVTEPAPMGALGLALTKALGTPRPAASSD